MSRPRVILADDHNLVTEALRKLIEPHFEVVATASDGQALIDAAVAWKPDIAVVDIAMPFVNGLEAGRELRKKLPGVKLVFLTTNEDPDLAVEAMKAGASGYLSKKSAAVELLEAMRGALRGKQYIAAGLSRGVEESFIRDPAGGNTGKSLTPRQREVVQLLAEGKSMKEVAEQLKIAARTVAFHKYRIMEDLGLKSNADLVQYALKSGVVTR